MNLAACVLLALAGATPPAPTSAPPVQAAPLSSASPGLFERGEPELEAGARALQSGDVDNALARFRKAKAEHTDERAIVEYDVGQALLARAQQEGERAQQQAAATAGATGQAQPPKASKDDDAKAAAKTALDDARASLERAYNLARAPGLRSESALAWGNAHAQGGDLEKAIEAYRKALVADPSNARAKTNLHRALEEKKKQDQQKQQQQQGGGDKGDDKKNDDDKKPDDKKSDEQKQGDKPDDKKSDAQKQGDQKSGDQKQGDKPDDKKGAQGGDNDDKKPPDDKKGEGQKPDDDKAQDPSKPQDAQAQQKKKSQETARRLLDALKSRERPLSPLDMRGGTNQRQKPAGGKDW
jgi:tetratricopeptide (TPR) repeat protein